MPGKGGKYCVAGFANARSCRNSSYSKGISMHMFPCGRGNKQRAAWTMFVRRHRPGWDPTSSSALCSAHFHGNDFTQRLDINVPTAPDRSPSSISCKRYLKIGTIPTIDDYDIASKSFPETTALNPTTPKLPAARVQRAKRQLLREVSQSTKRSKIHEESMAMAENQVQDFCASGDQSGLTERLRQDQSFLHDEQAIINDTSQDKLAEESEELFTCKRKLKNAQQRCSNYRRTIRRLQVQLQVKSKSSSSQPTIDSTSPTEMVDSLNELNEVEYLHDEFNGNLEVDPDELDDYLAEADTCMNSLKDDPDWEIEDELDLDDGEDTAEFNEKNQVRIDSSALPQDEPKFLVFLSCLVSIFSMFCFNCKSEKPKLQVSKSGTMVTIEQCCKECEKDGVQHFKWHSQPFVFGRYAAGNLLLSFAILCAGASISKTLLVFSHLGLCMYSARAFFAHQRWLLFPTIINFWESTRLGMMEKARLAKESVWAGDGRFDSMGHSAKYGAYTMMNASLGKLMHFELLQANETGSSQAMELEGAKRSFKFLTDSGVEVQTFVSDRHRGIAKWLKAAYPLVQHFYDIWHVSKSITKKLAKLAKEKGHEAVLKWIKPIRNHLYWCACSTKSGYEKLILAKWKSYSRHIANLHTNHPDPLFQKCVHEELPNRKWIRMGTDTYDKVVAICGRTQMLNDVKKLSPEVQTSHLEAFHSTLNQFHPKMTVYSYTGTYCRHVLAIAHFNENLKREAKKTKDGKIYYSIHYPKYKNGDELVRTVPVSPTYNYVDNLRKFLFNDTKAAMKLKIIEFWKNVPAPLSSQFSNRVDRLTAIENYIKRQEMNVQLYPSLSEQEQLQLTASGPEPTNVQKMRRCKKCKKNMKGHKRGQCS